MRTSQVSSKSLTRVGANMEGLTAIAVMIFYSSCYSRQAKRGIYSGTVHDESVYFHHLPLTESGEDGKPWGYWSLSADPDTGIMPDDELKIDGFELHHE